MSTGQVATEDLERDGEVGADEEVEKAALKPPPVNSGYLPLPWKGRLGYVRKHPTFHHTGNGSAARMPLLTFLGVPQHLPT